MAKFDFNDSKLREHEVRLFPTLNTENRVKEPEMRATSAFLSMVRAVAEFGGEIIKKAGGPGGKAKNVRCFTEVSFLPDFPEDNDPSRPDGIIRRVYGKNEWIALVEVKVGSNPIDEDQVKKYLNWANTLNFDALITISNQISQPNGDPPYYYKKNIKKVKVQHFSWEGIHNIVHILCTKEKEIEDVDQKWMLQQFNKYLTDDNSKIIAPPSFGKNWHQVLKDIKATATTLKVTDSHLQDVIDHWYKFLRLASLKLGAKIGEDVKVRIPEKFKKDTDSLIKEECKQAIDKKELNGELIFPRMEDIRLSLNLSSKEITFSHKIFAPEEHKRDTRVNWIVRELKRNEKVPPKLRIIVDWKKKGLVTSEEYEKLNDGIVPLLQSKDKIKIDKDVMPRWFILEHEVALKGAQGKGSEKELQIILDGLENFYRLVQPITRILKKPKPLIKEDSIDDTNFEQDITDSNQ